MDISGASAPGIRQGRRIRNIYGCIVFYSHKINLLATHTISRITHRKLACAIRLKTLGYTPTSAGEATRLCEICEICVKINHLCELILARLSWELGSLAQ